MTEPVDRHPVQKLATGIGSFDMIAEGGLPRNRTTLLSGTAGSGKTVFAIQFLAAGIEAGEPGGVARSRSSTESIATASGARRASLWVRCFWAWAASS